MICAQIRCRSAAISLRSMLLSHPIDGCQNRRCGSDINFFHRVIQNSGVAQLLQFLGISVAPKMIARKSIISVTKRSASIEMEIAAAKCSAFKRCSAILAKAIRMSSVMSIAWALRLA